MIEPQQSLFLDYGRGSYPIHIGHKLIGEPTMFADLAKYHHLAVITDENIKPQYLNALTRALPQPPTVDIVLPPGETQKTLQTLEQISGELISNRIGRNSALIALGGGVIGDITGFVAACYQRGIDFVQVPTTLLAQVDSSVGGKTGVNHPLGKNMIGAFHQPQAVIADLDAFATLPARQVRAGLAEVIKYGLIADADFFVWLEKNIAALCALETEATAYAVYQSCKIKADIVAKDEKETGAHRVLLNLGHTFGHAIETGLHHAGWLHGEAVAYGMILAAEFSAAKGWIAAEDANRIAALIEQAGLPMQRPDNFEVETMLDLMSRDKKNVSGTQRLVLLKKIGQAFAYDTDSDELRNFLANLWV